MDSAAGVSPSAASSQASSQASSSSVWPALASWSALAVVGLGLFMMTAFAFMSQYRTAKNRGETPFANPCWNRLREAIARGASSETIEELKTRCWASIACFHARDRVGWRQNFLLAVLVGLFLSLLSVPLRGGTVDLTTAGLGLTSFVLVLLGRVLLSNHDMYHGAESETCQFAEEVLQDGWAYALVRARKVDIDHQTLVGAGCLACDGSDERLLLQAQSKIPPPSWRVATDPPNQTSSSSSRPSKTSSGSSVRGPQVRE